MAKKNMQSEEKIIAQIFSDNIRGLMSERKIQKDQDIIDATGIGQSRFSNLMNVNTVPKATELLTLANYFGVSVDDLLREKGTKKEKTEKEESTKFSARQVCRALVTIDRSFPMSFSEESCEYMMGEREIICKIWEKYTGKYNCRVWPVDIKQIAIKFPVHIGHYRREKEEVFDDIFNQAEVEEQKYTSFFFDVNLFLKKYIDLKKIPDITDDDRMTLVNKWIDQIEDAAAVTTPIESKNV